MSQMDPKLKDDLKRFLEVCKITGSLGTSAKLCRRSLVEIVRLEHNYKELKKSYDEQTQRYNRVIEEAKK